MKRLRKSAIAFLVALGVMGQMMPFQASTAAPVDVRLGIKTYDKSNNVHKDYQKLFDVASSNEGEEINTTAIKLDPGAKANLLVQGTQLDIQQYQFIKHADLLIPPSIPGPEDASWRDLGDIPQVQANTTGAYLDLLLDKQGFLSTKHYNYKYDSTIYAANAPPPSRAETFGYPIGDDLVIQKAEIDPGNQYRNTEGAAAFFNKSNIGKTTFDATYTAPVTGNYRFDVYSNSGAYGYIMVNGVRKVVVNDLGANSTDNPAAHSTDLTVTLQAGMPYTIHMEWQQKSSAHIAPRLRYRTQSNVWSSRVVVPTEHFSNEIYEGGGNKAVKYWGFIIPDRSGKFNLGSFSDDGAYGYIVSGEERIVFVEDWAIAAAYNRTGDKDRVVQEIELVKDKVYPIYMEWYEGCPTEKAFTPRFTKAGESNWQNIPAEWFFASSNATPGEINIEYFEPYKSDTTALFPVEPGTYYVALQVKSTDGTVRQIINGPFIINGMTVNMSFPSKNYIVPESISNVCYEIDFNGEYKNIEYDIKLNDMIAADLDANALMKYDFNNASITLTKTTATGSVTKPLVKDTDYEITGLTTDPTTGVVTGVATGFKTKLRNADSTVAELEKHTINIYLRTHFTSTSIRYGKLTETPDMSTYFGKYIQTPVNNKVNVRVLIKATPVIRGTDQNGLPTEEDGATQSETKNIEIVYRQMARVL